MIEQSTNIESIEQKREMTLDWVKNISEHQEVKEIATDILKDTFESFGANFEITEEEKESLGGYSEKQKAEGMHAVWGEKFKEYKNWIKEYILDYETRTGKILPELKPSGRKNSGMIQFLGELTSYAAGEIDFDTFQKYVETRAKNGLAWEENRKGDRIRIKVPTSDKEEGILPSSFPPEFPIKAFEFLSYLD